MLALVSICHPDSFRSAWLQLPRLCGGLGGAAGFVALWICAAAVAQDPVPRKAPPRPKAISGIYPHLAMFNGENECGTGAVVPWADRLWVITYAPHKPRGSSDKLYEIDARLTQTIRPESIGGTPANRMIHRESQQLFLGPYVIGKDRNVRVIPYAQMFGRPTANARHLFDPVNKIYCATMEEGLYEIDVKTLAVTELWADEQKKTGRHSDLPGYHGKGLYSGQGRLVYANNGEHGARARRDPTTESGVLAEWDGQADAWTVVRRSQFTEVTGPGGIYGNEHPDTDPIWAIGWDHRSLILQVLDGGKWHRYRLPKGSHSYDGAHGWNTEWPRIRDVAERDLLMTMHGVFWNFPRDFRPGNTGGLWAHSAYLKVVGDFCRWQNQYVFGCDDTAKSEFLNKRKSKGEIAAPRSQSNVWFVSDLAGLGPVRAVGGVWAHEDVAAGATSDPFLLGRFVRRGMHLAHKGQGEAAVVLEIDKDGSGVFREWRTVTLPSFAAGGHVWVRLPDDALWLRVRAPQGLVAAVAYAHLGDRIATRPSTARFEGLAPAGGDEVLGGPVRARGGNKTSLAFAAQTSTAHGVVDVGCYELDVEVESRELRLKKTAVSGLHQHTLQHTRMPPGVFTVDDASVLIVDDGGNRWRLPRREGSVANDVMGGYRVVREVATERDLLHADGTFYELPAENAGGFRKLRPIATHELFVHDFCSYRGLLVMSGLDPGAASGQHIVRSEDGRAALWVGAIEDLYSLPAPRGIGGPWNSTKVKTAAPSDPYLATGYGKRNYAFSHDQDHPVVFTLEADICGDGRWTVVDRMQVPALGLRGMMPSMWSAYWVRLRTSEDCTATAQFLYR